MRRLLLLSVLISGFSAFAADPAQPQSAPPPSNSGNPKDIRIPSRDEMLRIRDPFKKPQMIADASVPRTELEMIPVENFKMVGVITGPDRVRAMLVDPTGKTHFVNERMKIGLRKGVIRKITADSILIQEKIVNVMGQEENVDTVLMISDKRSGASGT